MLKCEVGVFDFSSVKHDQMFMKETDEVIYHAASFSLSLTHILTHMHILITVHINT